MSRHSGGVSVCVCACACGGVHTVCPCVPVWGVGWGVSECGLSTRVSLPSALVLPTDTMP